MESDIEEGEIVEEANPAKQRQKQRQNQLQKPADSNKRQDAKIAKSKRVGHPTKLRSTVIKKITSTPALPPPPPPRASVARPKRIHQRHGSSSDSKRPRRISRSPSAELPRQYRNRLQQNIHRRRLESLHRSRSRSRTPPRRRIQRISRNPSPSRMRRIEARRSTNSESVKKPPPPRHSIFATPLNLKDKSGEDSDDSIISVAPPPKTPPLLIVLDSSHESDSSDDEDVSELQLRKEALEALLSNYKDGVGNDENASHPLNDSIAGLYSPYSPTPDGDDQGEVGQEDQDFRKELETLSQTRPIPANPASSVPIPLKERNGIRENTTVQKQGTQGDPMVQSTIPTSSNTRPHAIAEGETDRNFQLGEANGEELINYPQFVPTPFVSLPPIVTGDVDMRFNPFIANFNAAPRPGILPTPAPLPTQQNFNHLQNYQTDSYVGHNVALPMVPRFAIPQSSPDQGVHMINDGVRNSDLPFGHAFFDVDCRQNFSMQYPSGWPAPEVPNAVPNPFQLPQSLLPPPIPEAKLKPPENLSDLLRQASDESTNTGVVSPDEVRAEIIMKHVISVENDYHQHQESPDLNSHPLKTIISSGSQEKQPSTSSSKFTQEKFESSRRDDGLAEFGFRRRNSSKENINIREDIRANANIASSKFQGSSTSLSESSNLLVCQPPHISPSLIRPQSSSNTKGSDVEENLSHSLGKNVQEATVQNEVKRSNTIGRDVDIVISVNNDQHVPQRVSPVTVEEDSLIEDEEILRAQLLLDIARKKIINQPSQEPVTPEVIVSRSTKENVASSNAAPPSLDQSVRITKSFQNSRSKNRQIVRIVNADTPQLPQQNVPAKLPEKSLNKPSARASNVGGLQNIKRTVINTNLLKKNVYNKNADPLLKNLTITVANRVAHTPLIIPIRNDDSSSDEDVQHNRNSGAPSDGASSARNGKITQPATSTKSSASLSADFETSLNNLLKNSRDQPRPPMQVKRPVLSPEALQHMTASKREEYLQLKRQLADAERRIKRKQEKANEKLGEAKKGRSTENLNGRIRTTSSTSSKSPGKTKPSAGTKSASRSHFTPTGNEIRPPLAEIVQGITTESPKASLASIRAISDHSTDKSVKTVVAESEMREVAATNMPMTTQENVLTDFAANDAILGGSVNVNEIAEAVDLSINTANSSRPVTEPASSNEVVMEESIVNTEGIPTESTCGVIPEQEDQVEESTTSEALLFEDGEAEESSPVISFVPADKLLETESEDEQEAHNGALPARALSAAPRPGEAVSKKPMSKEREELYLRERLLKAALLKKMEDSSDMLLKRTERGVISSRADINRELNALLSEMVKMSDLKVVIKSRQEAVLKLRKQLRIAEQKLESTLVSFQGHDKHRKSLTSKALTMRKQCLDLVKQCKSQGTKLRGPNYRVPSVGALEMKSKLVEVRKQNVVFKEDYRKLKKSIARLNSPYEESINGKYSRLQFRHVPPSPSVVAANRLRRSVFSLRGKRASLTSTAIGSKSSPWKLAPQTSKWHKRRNNNKPRDYFEPSFPILSGFKRLTKYGNVSDDDSSAMDTESVFRLPKNYFKDVLVPEPYVPPSYKFLPVVRYSKYESPLESIREETKSSDTPLLSKGVDPFTSLCFFELRGICNDSKCPFQHLYRSQPPPISSG